MPPPIRTLGRQVFGRAGRAAARELGGRLSALALRRASSRILGKIGTRSRHWARAFEHIALHFRPDPTRAAHAVFEAAFRSRPALEELIQRAVRRPSQRLLTRATIHGNPAGRAVVVLEREFGRVIGQQDGQACTILRIIVDYTGRPITAYPIAAFRAGMVP